MRRETYPNCGCEGRHCLSVSNCPYHAVTVSAGRERNVGSGSDDAHAAMTVSGPHERDADLQCYTVFREERGHHWRSYGHFLLRRGCIIHPGVEKHQQRAHEDEA